MGRLAQNVSAKARRSPVLVLLLGMGLGGVFLLFTSHAGRRTQDLRTLLGNPTLDSNEGELGETQEQTALVFRQEGGVSEQGYPSWWREAWENSATSGKGNEFVGDKPLISPQCTDTKLSSHGSFGFVEPRAYLPESRNPCWWTDPKRREGLRCVPAFYLAGVAKCGTTDLFGRLRNHVDLMQGMHKEFHWWERYRFDGDVSFHDYTQQIGGDGIKVVQKEIKETGRSNKIFGDFSPSTFFHPMFWNLLAGNQGCTEPRVIVAQHLRHVYPQAKVILTFRHPTTRLYSRFLSRIPRTSFLKGSTPEDFHRYVEKAVKAYTRCFLQWSIRHCVYNATLFSETTTHLLEGMYPAFMQDWLRVFPRQQMHIMRYEDYGGHELEKVDEILQFLGLSPFNKTESVRVAEKDVSNSGAREYKTIGPMLPETKVILDEFYQPFIRQFADILNDKRFLWMDVKH